MNNEEIKNIVSAADVTGGISACASQEGNQGCVSAQGVSNTPANTSNEERQLQTVDAIIDYLKIVFVFPYDEYLPEAMEWWDRVLDALLVDRGTRVDMRRGGSNYELGWHYHEDLFVFTGGELTKINKCLPTSMLEMKGQACERFRQRAIDAEMDRLNRNLTDEEEEQAVINAWKNLFAILKGLPHRCTRIDLTVDDFGENVPIAPMMLKCKKRELVSSMKKGFGAGGVPIENWDDEEDAVIREGLGWSFTLGKTESERQVCIYDKKAEWVNGHHGLVNAKTWIRFESRFKSDRADFMLDAFIDRLLDSDDPLEFRKFIIGALASVIEFKEERNPGENTYRSPTWKPWADFVKIGVLPPKFKVKKPVMTVKNNALWEKKDVSRCHFRIRMAYMEESDEIDAYMMAEGMRRADGDDLAAINASRKARGKPTFESLEQLKEEGAKRIPGDGEIGEAVMTLFDDKVEVELTPVGVTKQDGGDR